MDSPEILLAIPETDARLRARERANGLRARTIGLPRESCPWDHASLIARWWFEGYDSYPDPKEGS